MLTKRPECRQFGRRMRLVREEKGISQEDLAALAGVHRTYVGGIERGERNPTLLTIHKLAKALEVPPHRLLDDTGVENS